jgi:hypothetical protein
MAFNMDVTSLIEAFGVDLTIYPATDKQGEYVDGHWVPEQADPIEVTEPFLPNSRIGMYSINRMLRETGTTAEYEAVWISKETSVPFNSVVERKGRRYIVVDVKDLTNYSNATVYYLSAEENQQSELVLSGGGDDGNSK